MTRETDHTNVMMYLSDKCRDEIDRWKGSNGRGLFVEKLLELTPQSVLKTIRDSEE